MEVKKFTCLNANGKKVEGAIEGTEEQVLEWMNVAFPGIHKATNQEMMHAWQFFYSDLTTTYETPEGKYLYLTEIDDE